MAKKNIILVIIGIVLFGSLAVWVFVGGPLSSSKRADLQYYLDLGDTYLLELNYEEAIIAFERAIEIDPQNIPARTGQGAAYVALEQYDNAERVLLEIVAIDEENITGYRMLVELYNAQGWDAKLNELFQTLRESEMLDRIPLSVVRGRVVDAQAYFRDDESVSLPGVTVTVLEEDASQYTDENGEFSFVLLEGTYSVTAELEGYITAHLNFEPVRGEIAYFSLIHLVHQSSSPGTVSGYIIDAFTGEEIHDARITVSNTADNTVTDEAYTNDNGEYRFQLQAGYYTLEASAPGYTTLLMNIFCMGGESVDNQNGAMTPLMDDGQMRIVLTWGATPADLDSHLTGPTPDGIPFHISYQNMTNRYQDQVMADLDLDDTDSYGPETTTIYNWADGAYSFFVHDFTNQNHPGSTELANSGATVQVYMNNAMIREFHVPTNQAGVVWHVFDYANGEITASNSFDFDIEVLYGDEYNNGWILIDGIPTSMSTPISQEDLQSMGFTRETTITDLVNEYGLPYGYNSLVELMQDMESGSLGSPHENGDANVSAEWLDAAIYYAYFDPDDWTLQSLDFHPNLIPLSNDLEYDMPFGDVAEILGFDDLLYDVISCDTYEELELFLRQNQIPARLRNDDEYGQLVYIDLDSDTVLSVDFFDSESYWNLMTTFDNGELDLSFYNNRLNGASIYLY